ncbi:hypothetical protein [Microbacterium suwonense]|uniref:Uncharacterized protein n=1 Tax=Microbacterium suwonense TaxID=683047 RepID=A0ABM8FVP6_9MICO|nr:hypothetical protein [Microbacterium suwonense]BDZ39593.1 hypothetical protein GCM10025863_22070 [Microbacterium suwonense]
MAIRPRIPGVPHAPHTGSPNRPPSAFHRNGSTPTSHPRGSSGSGRDNAGDVSKSKSKFQEFVDGASSVVGLINGILELASHIPLIGDIIDRINQLIQKMFEKVNEAIQKTAEIFAYVGSPTTLRQTGLSWVESVGAPATQATSTIIPSSLPSTGHWTGEAHDAYQARVELQQPAAEDLYDKCVMIDEQLNTFADAIVDFWVSFSIAAITTAVGVGLGIAEIVSVFGAPGGVATIIAEVVSFITDVIGLVNIILTANQAASDFMMEVTNSLGSTMAFPGGAWPRHAA